MKRILSTICFRLIPGCCLLQVAILSLLVSSCGSSKDLVYFQDLDIYNESEMRERYQLQLKADDIITIYVFSKNRELTEPFNAINKQSDREHRGLLINSDGYINYPIFGRIKVAGMTRRELEDYLKDRFIKEGLIKDPVITVRIENFGVLVLGEVKNPQMLKLESDRITLLDAIGMAGDLNVNARRDRIAVIREEGDHRVTVYHDLRDSNILNSPYFYLKQNDIIYVEPSKYKQLEGVNTRYTNARDWVLAVFSVISSAATIWLLAK